MERILFYLHQSKKITVPGQSLPKKYSEIEKISHYIELLEKINQLLWTTPLYSHTIHDPTLIDIKEFKKLTGLSFNIEDFDKESSDSIIMSYIRQYAKSYNFEFEDEQILKELKSLRDKMAKMWLYFKERQFKYAFKKITELSELSPDIENYKQKVRTKIKEIIPIISIYELFNRPLSKSVYPESIPQTKRLGAYLAKFLTSKYNIIGLNLIRLFYRLAFNNWSFLIRKCNLNKKEFFKFVLHLPTWKHIPNRIKESILQNNK